MLVQSKLLLLVNACVFVTSVGCTHTQLRYNTTHQARTVADVHTQQVLDNLAKFVHDPHALPHFSIPNQGGTSVTDTLSPDPTASFSPFGLTSWSMAFRPSRANNESYTLTPINDSEKLTLMRCAYQRAVSGCTCISESGHCPNCERRFNRFYLGSESVTKTGEVNSDGKAIFRVNTGVDLIYFPDAHRQSEYIPLESGDQVQHYVIADRNELNQVVYKYHKTDGAIDPNFLPRIGTSLSKLESSYFSTINEIETILRQVERGDAPSNVFAFYQGEMPISTVDLRHFVDSYEQMLGVDSSDQAEAISTVMNQAKQAERGEEFNSSLGTPSLFIKNNRVYLRESMQIQPGNPIDFEEINPTTNPSLAASDVLISVKIPKAIETSDLARPYVDNTLSEQALRSGRISPACIGQNCWFKSGGRHDAPKDRRCCYVGQHCGTYVWVPECGRDELTKLTLTVLDIALSDAASSPTTEVYAFIDKDGKTPTTYNSAAYLAKATIARGSSVSGVLTPSSTTASPPNEQEEAVLKRARSVLRDGFSDLLSKNEVNIYASLAHLDSLENDSVSFVDFDFVTRTVQVTDGDGLILLAASLLKKDRANRLRNGEEELVQLDAEAWKQISLAARHLLNAEFRLQDFSVEATAVGPSGIVTPRTSKQLDSGPGVLRSLLELNTLGR